jgi:N-ethylmaleimide reductase
VAFGRWFIGNPDLTERLRHGWPLAVADRAIYYSGGAQGYTDFARYERSRPATSTATAVRT